MKGKVLFVVALGLVLGLLRWKRTELTALLGGPPAGAASSPGAPRRPDAPIPPSPPSAPVPPTPPEASRPSDDGDALRTTLAAQNFPTGAAATEEVAVDSEDTLPDSPSTDDASGDGDRSEDNALERLAGMTSDPGNWVRGDGSTACPDDYPIKGNGSSHIYHMPGESSYAATIAELCFATEDAAVAEGFRPTKRNRHE